ncbi:MAG: ankyrin repeat domain-containing protein [Gemmatimonadota bacterium]
MGFRAIQALVALSVLVGSILYLEGYLGDVRDRGEILSCRRLPDELAAWRGSHTTVRADDMTHLDRWAADHHDRVNLRYGASCATALHQAADFGRLDAARILLARGAEPATRDRNGATPLHYAAREGHPAVAELLLEHGADPDSRDDGGRTPLMTAVFGVSTENLDGRLRLAQALLAAGANLEAVDRGSRRTALHVAADHQGDPAFVRLLLERRARTDAADSQGETPLHRAASAGSIESVRLLLDAGADPNAGPRGTALAGAALGGHVEVARLLVERGADIGQTGPMSPLPWRSAPLETAMLVPREREDRALEIAALLADRGADVDARSVSGRTYLHASAEEGRREWVRFLLDHGAAVDAPDPQGATPLHQAVRNGHLEVAELLLARGADAGLEASDGTTPLILARQDPEMESLLRHHGGR